jgi:hypothetical protein
VVLTLDVLLFVIGITTVIVIHCLRIKGFCNFSEICKYTTEGCIEEPDVDLLFQRNSCRECKIENSLIDFPYSFLVLDILIEFCDIPLRNRIKHYKDFRGYNSAQKRVIRYELPGSEPLHRQLIHKPPRLPTGY